MDSSNLEFAMQTRDELQRLLSTPVQGWIVATGERHESPPIDPAFHLEGVDIDSSQGYPHLIVKFRCNGETSLFAVSYRLDPDDDFNWGVGPEGFAMSIKVALEEDLLSDTLTHAVRELRDGIVWLRWDSP